MLDIIFSPFGSRCIVLDGWYSDNSILMIDEFVFYKLHMGGLKDKFELECEIQVMKTLLA